MQEFSSVTASSYDAESLAPMLTEKAGEGWSVVSIVSAGTNVVAYLSRGAGASADDSSVDDSSDAANAAIAEPAGEAAAIAPATETASPTDATVEPAVDTTAEPADIDSGFGSIATGAVGTTDAAATLAGDAPDVTPISPTLPGESVGDGVDSTPEPATDPGAEQAAAAVAAADEPAGWGAAPADDVSSATAIDSSIADLAAQVGADDATAQVADAGDAMSDMAAGTVDEAGSAAPFLAGGTASDVTTTAAETPAVAEPAAEPAAAEPAAEPAAAEPAAAEPAAADSGVPAGWYADPSGRFELRYWDGGAWTEHVSRAGQQYTDPPVA